MLAGRKACEFAHSLLYPTPTSVMAPVSRAKIARLVTYNATT